MTVILPNIEALTQRAVAHYWTTLGKQGGGSGDRRKDVVGGRQMNGFCHLVHEVLCSNGLPDASVYYAKQRVVPGYFRATKDWDLVVVHRRQLVAAIEFKSQVGSFGNNANNRIEEAIGNALDLLTAHRDGAFGDDCARPFLGWVMLLEDSEKSQAPIRLDEPHFPVFPDFVAPVQRPSKTKAAKGKIRRRDGVSYMRRYELLLRRLVLENLYDSTALLVSPRAKNARTASYSEPADDLTMRRLLGALAGHVAGHLAGLPPVRP